MNQDRKNLAHGIVAFVVLSVTLSAGLGEMRVRMLIDYPWLHDREHVLETLDKIETRLERLELLAHPDSETSPLIFSKGN